MNAIFAVHNGAWIVGKLNHPLLSNNGKEHIGEIGLGSIFSCP